MLENAPNRLVLLAPVLRMGGSPTFDLFTFQTCSAMQTTRKKSATTKRKYWSKFRLSRMLLRSALPLDGSNCCRITNSSVEQGWSISMKSSSKNWTNRNRMFWIDGSWWKFRKIVESLRLISEGKLKGLQFPVDYRRASKRTRPIFSAELARHRCRSSSAVAFRVRSQRPDCI